MDKTIVEKDEGAVEQPKQSLYIPGKPYLKLTRELAAEDLSNPAVQKLLLNEIDKLESQVSNLESVEAEFYKVDKENAVLKAKIQQSSAFEVLYAVCLSIGSASIGLSRLFDFDKQGWILVLMGGILILCGILTKIIKR